MITPNPLCDKVSRGVLYVGDKHLFVLYIGDGSVLYVGDSTVLYVGDKEKKILKKNIKKDLYLQT